MAPETPLRVHQGISAKAQEPFASRHKCESTGSLAHAPSTATPAELGGGCCSLFAHGTSADGAGILAIGLVVEQRRNDLGDPAMCTQLACFTPEEPRAGL